MANPHLVQPVVLEATHVAACSSVLMMPSLGMADDEPLEAVAGQPVRRWPTTSWSRAALNVVRWRTSAASGNSKEKPVSEGVSQRAARAADSELQCRPLSHEAVCYQTTRLIFL